MYVSPGSRATRKRNPGTSAPLALNFGTITSNPGEPTPGMGLSIYGTWNNSGTVFDAPLFMNITNTASAAGSRLFDFQAGGLSQMAFQLGGTFAGSGGQAIPASGLLIFHGDSGTGSAVGVIGGSAYIGNGGGDTFTDGAIVVASRLSFAAGSPFAFPNRDINLIREAAGQLALSNSTNATALRVYNTSDNQFNGAPTNYERGVFDWTTTTNTLTVGPQAGGTGTFRTMNLIMGGSGAGLVNQVAWVGASNNITFQYFGNTFVTFGNTFVSLGTNVSLGLGSGTNLSWGGDCSITRIAANVLQVGDGGANVNGWVQWAGQQRVTSDFSRSNSTAATAITGISSVLVGHSTNIRNYKFEAWLATAGSTAGGISVAITCTSSTITALSVDGFILDSNVVRGQQGVITSTTTPVVNSSAITSSAPTVRLQGLIRGVSSGTFGLSLAQSTANATAVIVSSGSWLEVFDVP